MIDRMDDAPAIRVRDLVKTYGDVKAVAGIAFDVARGECFGLLGPNGAGKTTTVEILEGLLEPTSGDVQVLGERWARDGRRLRSRIGIALQETQLADRLTAIEVVRLFRSFHPRGRAPDEVLATVGLAEKRDAWVMRLSGGQRQKLAIACALVGDPDLLFLDEPTTGLDPQSRRALWEVVGSFRERGRTVLLTTHYMDEAERLCDRVAIVDHGKIIALGTPAELIGNLGVAEFVEFSTAPDLPQDRLDGLPGLKGVRRIGDRWSLAVEALRESVPALLDRVREQGATLTGLATHQASLEDVFVALTGRKLEGGNDANRP
jgi:ABC-2 type transport system ATP-binding protein